MATYGMMDAANLVLIDKKTKLPVLKADYANETTVEWSSDRVFATKKGANAIAWDSARKGTLKLNTEIFSLKLLAIAMGSQLDSDGTDDVFHSQLIEVPAVAGTPITLEAKVKEGSLSVFKLAADGLEHDGDEVPAQITGGTASVPTLVENVAVTANDSSAVITWAASDGATSYIVMRDGAKVGQPSGSTYTDTGLSADKEYTYTVVGVNANGQGPVSAQVKITTASEGSTDQGATVNATQEDIDAAKAVADAMSGASGLNYKLIDFNKLQFSDSAVPGDAYVAYFLEETEGNKSITIDANKFSGAFEIYADALMREQESGQDSFIKTYFPNARPQSNFTFTQSAKEPAAIEITFDLMPDKNGKMAKYTFVD